MLPNRIYTGGALDLADFLAPGSVNSIITSPPYWGLRSYLPQDHPDKDQELGTEKTPEEYVAKLVEVFRALRPALRDDGTCWINLGDSYATSGMRGPQGATGERATRTFTAASLPAKVPPGCKPKDLIGIPWLVAFALRADGWYLRSDIIWAKKNPMPESVRDRPTRSHEYLFLLAKSSRYYYDGEAVAEPSANAGEVVRLGARSFAKRQADGAGVTPTGNGNADTYAVKATRNKRDVWTLGTVGYPEAHYATFPPELVRPCILAGCPPGGLVLDPFAGSGTVAQVCAEEGRDWIGFDLDERTPGFTARRLLKIKPREEAAD